MNDIVMIFNQKCSAIVTHALLLTLLLFVLLILGCDNSNEPQTASTIKDNVAIKNSFLKSNLSMPENAEILHYSIDNERYDGLEDWLLYSNSQFEPSELEITSDLTEIRIVDGAVKRIEHLIGTNKIEKPLKLYHVEWVTFSKEKYQADILTTSHGYFLLLTHLP
jgi:hypothetical protein